MKNRHGHRVCWRSTGRRNASICQCQEHTHIIDYDMCIYCCTPLPEYIALMTIALMLLAARVTIVVCTHPTLCVVYQYYDNGSM